MLFLTILSSKLLKKFKKNPKYNELKGNPEIFLMVCNCVENIITKKDGCYKKDIVIEIIKQFLI